MRNLGGLGGLTKERNEFLRFRESSGTARLGTAADLQLLNRLNEMGIPYKFRHILAIPERYKADFYLHQHGIMIEMAIPPDMPYMWARRMRDKRQRLFDCRESVKCLMLARNEIADLSVEHIEKLQELPNGVYEFSHVSEILDC
jgi:hypothetical protein